MGHEEVWEEDRNVASASWAGASTKAALSN